MSETTKPVASAVVKTAFAETDRDQALARWRELAGSLRDRFGDVAGLMERAIVRHRVRGRWCAPSTMSSPAWLSTKACGSKLHSTNPLDRVDKEIKRRTNAVGILPGRAAVARLVGAPMPEQTEEWAVSRRRMPVEKPAVLGNDDPDAP